MKKGREKGGGGGGVGVEWAGGRIVELHGVEEFAAMRVSSNYCAKRE